MLFDDDEETFGSEKQCVSFLKFINSETTLAEYMQSFFFEIALQDMDKLLCKEYKACCKARDLFKIQPCFSESKFESTVGYNDPRCHMFLGNIANSLPTYDGW
jgi:hypothetical protein